VHNDTAAPVAGHVHWSLEMLDGEPLLSGDRPLALDAFAAQRLPPLDFADHLSDDNRRDVILVAELWAGDRLHAGCVAPFVPSKHLRLADPDLTATVQAAGGRLTITITAQGLARFVELALDGVDALFSDNYFDLPAGRTRTITAALPPGWTAAQAQAALRLRSLFDSYT
jgi:beta-mannosidase